MPSLLTLHLGVKTDPIEYRYSWPWLFRILAEEDVHYVQIGTFFEIYQLPDDFFLKLRDQAAQFGVQISSVFTAHRELGGFFSCDPAWEADVTVPPDLISRMMRRELQICGTWNSDYSVFAEDDDWHRSLAAMLSGAVKVKPLISHRVALNKAFDALQMMRNRSEFYCKVLISPEIGV